MMSPGENPGMLPGTGVGTGSMNGLGGFYAMVATPHGPVLMPVLGGGGPTPPPKGGISSRPSTPRGDRGHEQHEGRGDENVVSTAVVSLLGMESSRTTAAG